MADNLLKSAAGIAKEVGHEKDQKLQSAPKNFKSSWIAETCTQNVFEENFIWKFSVLSDYFCNIWAAQNMIWRLQPASCPAVVMSYVLAKGH